MSIRPIAYRECRHILTSGARCHAPAMRGKPCCYYHSRQRTLIGQNMYRSKSVVFPPLEDRSAIQLAIGEVLAALGASKIDQKKASTLIYGLHFASRNLSALKNPSAPDAVTDVYRARYGDVLAPEDNALLLHEEQLLLEANRQDFEKEDLQKQAEAYRLEDDSPVDWDSLPTAELEFLDRGATHEYEEEQIESPPLAPRVEKHIKQLALEVKAHRHRLEREEQAETRREGTGVDLPRT